jgi:capping protein beta
VGESGNEGAGEGAVPSERVRKMEIKANEAFDVYRDLYYEGGVSSVYFWNLDDGFAGVVLLKKGMQRLSFWLARARDHRIYRDTA